ncbi:MAG: hypothetical protein NT130_05740 [Candidatus Micrarchaeota archaeon]|nr:hypothetical protein [Candidatus Micrarchaeota archaeon]
MFEEFFGSKSIDVVKGVAIGIELEKKSIEYYSGKSKNIESKELVKLLKFITEEEVNHLKQLETLKQSLMKNRTWIGPEKLGKPEGPKLYSEGVSPMIREDSGDVGILLGAIRAEEEAREFYEEFSRRIKDEKGRKFFQRLVEFEQSHYNLFDGILKSSEVRVEGGELP